MGQVEADGLCWYFVKSRELSWFIYIYIGRAQRQLVEALDEAESRSVV